MINRKIGFDVVYQVGKEEFERDRVKAIKFAIDGSEYDEVQTAGGKVIQLQPLYAFLFQFTGEFDKDGRPVHDGDILAAEDGTILFVSFYAGAYWLQVPGDEENATILGNQSCRALSVVGDVVRNATMIVPPDVLEKLQAAEGRLAPFVNLPLADKK